MHYNENANRGQAKTKKGEKRFLLRFPKYKKGEATVVKLLKEPTYGENLMLTISLNGVGWFSILQFIISLQEQDSITRKRIALVR